MVEYHSKFYKTMIKKTILLVFYLCFSCMDVSQAAEDVSLPFVEPLQPGDLLFFWTSEKIRHVGIYLEDGRFFHSSTSAGVTISDMNDDYWRYRLIMVRRVNHDISLPQLKRAFSKYDYARYGFGYEGPDRFDCSGLVWRVFKEHGVELPRTTREQMRQGRRLRKG